jgi:RND family efflux transporter MFP subunit
MKDPLRIAALALLCSTPALSAFGRIPAAQPEIAKIESAAAIANSFGGYKTFTFPSRDSTLSFTFATEIAEVMVIGGTPVKKGDILVRGRDEELKYQRDLQKIIAESDLDVQKAEAGLRQAQIEFDAQKQLRAKKVDSPQEYDRAEVLVTLRTIELGTAKVQLEQQKIQLSFRQTQLDRMTLRAPFDGKVDSVTGDVGEVKRETDPIIRVVATDPLWMDVQTPIEQTITQALKPGDPAWVLIDLPGEAKVYKGKIVEVAADATFESRKRRVRVALPNPSDWPSGPGAWVRFTPPEGEWAKRVVEQGPARAGAQADQPPMAGPEAAAHQTDARFRLDTAIDLIF